MTTRQITGSSGSGYQQLPPQDPRAAQLASRLDKNALFDQLIKPGDPASVLGTDTVNGEAAVKLKPQSGPGVLYVAADSAAPYPLRVESPTQGNCQRRLNLDPLATAENGPP